MKQNPAHFRYDRLPVAPTSSFIGLGLEVAWSDAFGVMITIGSLMQLDLQLDLPFVQESPGGNAYTHVYIHRHDLGKIRRIARKKPDCLD